MTTPSRIPIAPLAPAEWRAIALDGEAFALGDSFLCLDSLVTPAVRASTLHPAVHDNRIFAERLTAAWVYGWLPVEPPPQFAVNIRSRVPSAVRRRVGGREVVIGEGELRRFGGVAVTSEHRTLCDLAREPEHAVSESLLTELVRASMIEVEDLRERLERSPRVPFLRRARERLSAVAHTIDVVDGVDAAHRIEDPVQVRHVAHLEDKLADRQAVA